MAIQLRAISVLGTSTFESVVGAIPTGTVANDIILAIMDGDSTVAWTTASSGWTILGDTDNGAGFSSAIAWKRAVGGDANPTFTQAGTATIKTVRLASFLGVRVTGDPWDVVPTSRANAAATTVTATGLTTTSADNMIVMFAASTRDANSTTNFSTWACATDPTSLSEQFDQTVNTGTGAGSGMAIGAKASAGATGDGTATYAVSGINNGYLISLVPEPPPEFFVGGLATMGIGL